MNKKGFTLIEVLAIIAIIAVIGIITVPLILNVLDDSKKNTAYDSVYGYTRAIKDYYYTKHLQQDNADDFVGRHYKIDSDGFLALKDGSLVHQILFTGVKPDSGLIDIGLDGEINGCIVVNEYRFYIENDEILDDILKGDDCRETYTITFDTQGGNSIDPITAKEGSTVNLPTPVKTLEEFSLTFDGWYDSNGNLASNTMPDENITYYAHYESLVAKFDTDIVSKVKSTANNSTSNIYKFLRADSIDSEHKTDTYKVSNDSDSDVPIYMWYDSTNHIVYWYSLSEHPGFKGTSLYQLFSGASNLTDISGVADWDVSSITDMRYVFYKTAITNVNALANWAQWTSTKKLTDMYGMFAEAKSLSDISGLSNWDISNVTSLRYMFQQTAITNVNALSNWAQYTKITNMDFMFDRAASLSDISGLSNWDISKVSSMSCLFRGTAITNVNALATWAQYTNTTKITSMSNMFANAANLADISGLSNWNVSKVTDMNHIFSGATSLSNINGLSNWNTSNVTNMSYMFSNATNLADISGLSNWNVSKVTNMSYMFSGVKGISNINVLSNWAQYTNTAKITDMSYMFSNATNLADISGLSNWNISNVANMSYMFRTTAITNLNALANWAQYTSTAKITNMSYMFDRAASLSDISGLSNWNVSNVTNISYMFRGATSLSDISGLSNWNISNVTNMSFMFQQTAITNVNALANWAQYTSTNKLTNLSSMFSSVTSLSDISGLSRWNVANVKKMESMFYGTAITNVDALLNWNVGNVEYISGMFQDATSLSDISGLANWNLNHVSTYNYMFSGTTNITDASSLHWYIGASKKTFKEMFKNSGVRTSGNYPTFYSDINKTQIITGTWNSSGTFTPSN